MIYVLPGLPTPMIRSRDQQQRKLWNETQGHRERMRIILTEQHGDLSLYEGPLGIDASFYFPHPQTVHRDIEPRPRLRFHSAKPRIMDLLHFVENIGKGILFSSECSVAFLSARKCYDDHPRTEIIIKSVEKP